MLEELMAQKKRFHDVVQVRYVDDQVRADDCSAYLAYIVDRYDDLPEFAVFLHADAPEATAARCCSEPRARAPIL